MKPAITSKSILFIESLDDDRKKTLQQTIVRKKKILLSISAKVEMLRMDLEIIKREYHVRIGRLYLKDDQLDLEIIRYKHIKHLLDQGKTYDEAVKKINDTYYSEKKLFDFRNESIEQDEAVFSKRKNILPTTQKELKTLWKKLLFQLHPDLTTDAKEKIRRDEIIRKINDAYAENDYDTLKNIENKHIVDDFTDTTITHLEQRIMELENAIISLEMQYKNLRTSEWYVWRKKSQNAKKKNIDIFKELEEKLLEDIVKKIEIVNVFRKEFDKKGYY